MKSTPSSTARRTTCAGGLAVGGLAPDALADDAHRAEAEPVDGKVGPPRVKVPLAATGVVMVVTLLLRSGATGLSGATGRSALQGPCPHNRRLHVRMAPWTTGWCGAWWPAVLAVVELFSLELRPRCSAAGALAGLLARLLGAPCVVQVVVAGGVGGPARRRAPRRAAPPRRPAPLPNDPGAALRA